MLHISLVDVKEGLYCQYKDLAAPFCVNHFHSTAFQMELMLSRKAVSPISDGLLKYCRAVNNPSSRYEVSTMSAPLFDPKGTVTPVDPLIQCENAPCQR